jgi:hypothetical protein
MKSDDLILAGLQSEGWPARSACCRAGMHSFEAVIHDLVLVPRTRSWQPIFLFIKVSVAWFSFAKPGSHVLRDAV